MRRQVASFLVICLALLLLSVAGSGSAAAEENITVEVTVVDQDGNSVSEADVTVEWANKTAKDETFSDGTVLFDIPAGADLKLSVDHGAYVQNFPKSVSSVSLEEGQQRATIQADVSLAGTMTLNVSHKEEPEENVKTRIRDIDKNKWVKATETGDGEFKVSTGNDATGSFRTNADGNVSLERIEQGEYELETSKPGFLETVTEVTLDGTSVHETIPVERSRVRIDFFVKDDHFDPPTAIEGAAIEIPSQGSTLETFDDGAQDTTLPVNKKYEIEVTKDGYNDVSETLRVNEEAKTVNFTTQRTPALTLDPLNTEVIAGQTTRVTVTNAYDEPVEGATVLLDENETGQTDAAGGANVEIAADGNHTISVEHNSVSESVVIEGFDPDAEDVPEEIQDQVDGENESEDTESENNESEDGDADDGGAGFGPLVAIGAVLAALGLARFRRR